MTELLLAPGDRVVYPQHGPGVVVGLTERKVLGNTERYFDIELTPSGMRVMVPVARAQALGLRRAMSADEVPELLAALSEPDMELPEGFQARYRREQAVLEGGNLREITSLVGTLTRRDVTRGLSDSEQAILTTGKRVLAAELSAALGLEDLQARKRLEEELTTLISGAPARRG